MFQTVACLLFLSLMLDLFHHCVEHSLARILHYTLSQHLGIALLVGNTLSFIVQIYLSTLRTCWSCAVILSITPMVSNAFLKCSNCPSPRICCTLSLLFCMCRWFYLILSIWLHSFSFIISTVPKCTALDVVITKGILLTFMMFMTHMHYHTIIAALQAIYCMCSLRLLMALSL